MNAGMLLLHLLFHLFSEFSIIPLKGLHFYQFLSPPLPQCWLGSSYQHKKEFAQDLTPHCPVATHYWPSFLVPTFSVSILGSVVVCTLIPSYESL